MKNGLKIVTPFLRKYADPTDVHKLAAIARGRGARTDFFRQLQHQPDYFGGYGLDSHKAIMAALVAYDQGRFVPPTVIELHLSDICNLRCSFCTGFNLPKKTSAEEPFFTKATTRRTVQQIIDFWARHGTKIKELKFGGQKGDPLVKPQLVKAGMEAVRDAEAGQDVKVGIFTNGIGLLPKTWPTINQASYVFYSRNGASDQTIAAIGGASPRLIERATQRVSGYAVQRPADQPLYMGYNILPENIDEAYAAIALARKMHCSGVRYKFDLTQENISDEFRGKAIALQSQLREEEQASQATSFRVWAPHLPFDFYPRPELVPGSFFRICVAQFGIAAVSDTGDVHGCYLGPAMNPDLHFGSLREADFQQIWEGERRQGLVPEFPTRDCVICPTAPWLQNNIVPFRESEQMRQLNFIQKILSGGKD